jgi:hypothetical protein
MSEERAGFFANLSMWKKTPHHQLFGETKLPYPELPCITKIFFIVLLE